MEGTPPNGMGLLQYSRPSCQCPLLDASSFQRPPPKKKRGWCGGFPLKPPQKGYPRKKDTTCPPVLHLSCIESSHLQQSHQPEGPSNSHGAHYKAQLISLRLPHQICQRDVVQDYNSQIDDKPALDKGKGISMLTESDILITGPRKQTAPRSVDTLYRDQG